MSRKSISRRSFLLGGSAVLAGVGASAISGCNNSIANISKATNDPGVLTACTAHSTPKVSPCRLFDCLTDSINTHIYEGLYDMDHATGEVYEGLAIGDPKRIDDLTYEIEFKNDQTFSDGTRITGETLESVLGYYMADEIYDIFFLFIKAVETIGDNKLSLKLNYHLDEDFLKRRLCVARIFKYGTSANGTQDVTFGSGPYRLKSCNGNDGGTIEFLPNGYYDGKKPPRAQEMKWSVILDEKPRLRQLIDGKAAIIEDVPPNEIDNLTAKGFGIYTKDSYSMPVIVFNTSKEPFNDIRVRQAILYALHEERIIDQHFKGYASIPTSYLPENAMGYHRCQHTYEYNPDKARELLDEVGKKRISFSLLISPASTTEAYADDLRNNFGEVGIQCSVTVDDINWDLLVDENNPYNFDAFIVTIDPSLLGFDTDILLSSLYGDGTILNEVVKWSKCPGNRYDELQKLLKDGRSAPRDKQQEYWDKAQEIIAEHVPIYPILHRRIANAFNKHMIKDYKGNLTSGLYLLGAAPVAE